MNGEAIITDDPWNPSESFPVETPDPSSFPAKSLNLFFRFATSGKVHILHFRVFAVVDLHFEHVGVILKRKRILVTASFCSYNVFTTVDSFFTELGISKLSPLCAAMSHFSDCVQSGTPSANGFIHEQHIFSGASLSKHVQLTTLDLR